jgi:oligopeptidase A
VSYIACSFPLADGLRFAEARSLFHEFGHAVNHLLIRERLPHAAGLERVPVERSEVLATWFEQWVHHDEFAGWPGIDSDALPVVARAERLKERRDTAEIAVTAALDFEVHRDVGGGLADAYRRLDDRFGVSAATRFVDLPPAFVRPALTTRPGLYFRYPWAAADSATTFEPYRRLTLPAIAARPELRDTLTPYLHIGGRSAVPDTAALRARYETAVLGVGDRTT